MKRRLVSLPFLLVLVYLFLRIGNVSLSDLVPPQALAQVTHLLPSPASADAVTGPPTVTASFITQVLTQAHSPAHDLGPLLYQQGVAHQINPAFVLAIFHHESDYGRLGVAALTHNVGNIRCTSGWKCDPSGGYRWYPTWADGVIDLYRVLQTVYLQQQRDTVGSILPVYAPASDRNNTAAYIQAVRADLARWQQGQV